MSYEPLVEFRETGTHSKVCDGCHMTTIPGWGVIILLVSELGLLKLSCCSQSPVDIGGIVSLSSIFLNRILVF